MSFWYDQFPSLDRWIDKTINRDMDKLMNESVNK